MEPKKDGTRKDGTRKDGKRNKAGAYRITAALCGIVCVGCIAWVINYLADLSKAETEMDAIRNTYIVEAESSETDTFETPEMTAVPETVPEPEVTETPEPAQTPNPSDYGLTDRRVDIQALQEEQNPHIYAWITVPGTAVDFPVLQHPEQTDYYLDYNVNGTKGYPGGIYTQNMNAKDWSDPNTVIYGHNVKGAFKTLHSFEDKDFFDENRYIHIYTEDGKVLVYEIFAAYVYSNAHLLLSFPLYTEEDIKNYYDSIFDNTGSKCHFLEDRELAGSDKIITLSTCIGAAELRYLVQGVLIAEVEQP